MTDLTAQSSAPPWDTGTDELLATLSGHVLTITLNRPQKRNALSDRLTPALRETLRRADVEPGVRCVVITGAGNAFCAGGDVSGMGSSPGSAATTKPPPEARPSLEDRIAELRERQRTLTLRLHELSKPTIAALPGPAAGAGLSIALACDIRLITADTFVTTAFANIGLSGDYGASWFLTQLVGPSKAKELFFTARRVTSDEGLTMGLFNEVVSDGDVRDRANALAQEIAAGPPVAIRYMKENLNRAVTESLADCLAMEADRTVRSATTADHKAAVTAFVSKSKPVFEGR